MNTEPIIVGLAPAAVTGLITAAVNVVNAFGIATVTDPQLQSLNGLAIAAMVVLGGIGIWWARRRATSLASPNVPMGSVVRTYDPTDGSAGPSMRV